MRGFHDGSNPAIWRGFIEHLLPCKNKIAQSRHHPAMPHQRVAAFMEELECKTSISALALRFLILTATRTGEVIGASWSEIDQQAQTWIIPASRMKAKRDPYVPHGFRSTFRDWCAERTDYPRELAESALAHVLKNKVEAAYQRSDLLEKRRPLMQDWANYCFTVTPK